MHRRVRVILPVRGHRQHVPEHLVQAHLLVLIRLVLIRLVPEQQRDLGRRLVPVRKQVPLRTVKVEKQVAAQGKVQAGETIVVVPIIEITVPKETIVLPVVVIPVMVILVVVILAVVVLALPGAMFPADKQKDVLLPEVREVITLKALPVPLKEVAVQEDNLFLYYLYQSHCSSVVGELDSGFLSARLFRASPVTWNIGADTIRLDFTYYSLLCETFCNLSDVANGYVLRNYYTKLKYISFYSMTCPL